MSNIITPCLKPPETREEKKEIIAEKFREIMEVIGLNVNDEALIDTPERVAKMYVDEIFSGLKEENFPSITFFENPSSDSHMVFVKAPFVSTCEHHFLPIQGMASIAYLPQKKLIGLSKIPRLVNYFAKRPQLQERLSVQVADKLSELLETDHVAISITAKHFCMIARGTETHDSQTVTNVLRGDFRKDALLRREFFEAIKA